MVKGEADGSRSLNYQVPKENLEEIKDWLLKRTSEGKHKTKTGTGPGTQELEAKQNHLSSIWFYFSKAWTDWCQLVRDKAEQDRAKLRNISFPLISPSTDEEYRRDFPYYDQDSTGFGPTVKTQKRFFKLALSENRFPLLDPFVLKPYLETLILYYAFIASEMPSTPAARIDNAFIQMAWQAGYYSRAINEELSKWERTDASNIAKQNEAEKRREAIKAFVLGNPRLSRMSQRSLAEYMHKNFPWGHIKKITIPQLRKDLAKILS